MTIAILIAAIALGGLIFFNIMGRRPMRATNLIASHISSTVNEQILHHQTMRRLEALRHSSANPREQR